MTLLKAQQEEAEIHGEDGETIINPVPLDWPALPSWSVEELELLRSGDLELGVDLFQGIEDSLSVEDLFEPLPEQDVLPEPEVDPNAPMPIPEEFLASYYSNRPAEYLIDPQGLLSMQEQKDRQSFLDYHAGDSNIDLHIYLFDKNQIIPEQGDIATIFQRHFNRGKGLTALVYYYLGNPERAQFVASPEVANVVGIGALHGALKHAQEQAESKSEPASQLEGFSTALSIRLYWMERELAEAEGEGRLLAEVGGQDAVTVVQSSRRPKPKEMKEDHKFLIFLAVSALTSLVIGLIVIYKQRQAKKRYLFPEVETKPLLSAPHAAGVGAVIHFGNATLPPSLQREQVPDYLRKM